MEATPHEFTSRPGRRAPGSDLVVLFVFVLVLILVVVEVLVVQIVVEVVVVEVVVVKVVVVEVLVVVEVVVEVVLVVLFVLVLVFLVLLIAGAGASSSTDGWPGGGQANSVSASRLEGTNRVPASISVSSIKRKLQG